MTGQVADENVKPDRSVKSQDTKGNESRPSLYLTLLDILRSMAVTGKSNQNMALSWSVLYTVLQLLGGLARLEIASSDEEAAGLSEAKEFLVNAAAGPKSNATVLAALLLAEMEASGNKKRREERVAHHMQQVE